MLQFDVGSGPHARMSGVRNQNRIVGQDCFDLAANPFRSHRRSVRIAKGIDAGSPLADQFLNPVQPLLVRLPRFQRLEHLPQHRPAIATERHSVGIIPSEFFGSDVQLNDWRAFGRDSPTVRDLAAGAAADEKGQIGFRDHTVGALARIQAHDTCGKRMVLRDRSLGVQRRNHWNTKHFRQLDNLGPSRRSGNAAAGNDNRTLGLGQNAGRSANLIGVGQRSNSRVPRKLRLEDHVQIGFPFNRLAEVPGDLQMHRPRTTCGRRAERLTQQIRQSLRNVHLGVELRERLKKRIIVNFLIDVAVFGFGKTTAGERDHGRAPQKGIA